MHQQVPSLPPLPQSNAAPQRAQARRRRGNELLVGAVSMAPPSVRILPRRRQGFNHGCMTGLRRPWRSSLDYIHSREAWLAAAINVYDT